MSADFKPHRFIEELNKLPQFTPAARGRLPRDRVPPWRATFMSLIMYGQGCGYKLFTFDKFFKLLCASYRNNKKTNQDLVQHLIEPGVKRFEQRARAWYDGGMCETYVQCCLATAIEDELKAGVVLYDARGDWKLKADLTVLIAGKAVMIDVMHGYEEDREEQIAWREANEREAKKNTLQSSHFDNVELQRIPRFAIAVNSENEDVVKGVRLCTRAAVNALLTKIYDFGDVPVNKRVFLNDRYYFVKVPASGREPLQSREDG